MAQTTPAFLRALGRSEPPAQFDLNGRRYLLDRVFKHDFFAATARYRSDDDLAILKTGRVAWMGPVPMRWIGRILAGREAAALARLAGDESVPRLLGRLGPTGIVRQYIEGSPLRRGLIVPDKFHSRLADAVARIHAAEMAYVDLEKAENVLLGEDGNPYLIDFQIAWYWPRSCGGGLWPLSAIRRWLQSGDLYHLQKLKRRTRPDQMTEAERAATYDKPWFVRLHTTVTAPLKKLRRLILQRIDPRRSKGERGSVSEDTMGGA